MLYDGEYGYFLMVSMDTFRPILSLEVKHTVWPNN